MADKIFLHRAERSFSRLSTATHFSEADQTLISLDFNDRTNEPSPMTAVCMPQRRFQRNRNGRRSDVDDFHFFCVACSTSLLIYHLTFIICHLKSEPLPLHACLHPRI